MMTKRERVQAVLEGRNPDVTPSSFSLHFSKEKVFELGPLQTHLEFFRDTDVDILKVMNENQFPPVPNIAHPDDWKKVPTYSRKAPFIQAQADLIKEVRDAVHEDAMLLCTIHGTCASTVHTMRPQYSDYYQIRAMQCAHYRTNRSVFLDATKRVAEAQMHMVEEAIDAGADGIYYAVLGGEKDIYTKEEYEEILKPYDLQIMHLCRGKGKLVVLHMCKKNLDFSYFDGYADECDIVNWGIYENNLSLAEGEKLFPGKVIMGGLANRSGVLVDGSGDELTYTIHSILEQVDRRNFILGADCTLPSNIPYSRIRAAVMAARTQ